MPLPAALARALAAVPSSVKAHARSRAASLAVASLAAVAISTSLSAIPEATPSGVAAALGEAAGGIVEPGDFVWAPSRGALADAVWGRDVTFLARVARPGERTPRDVLRGRVSIAPGGHPLRVEAVVRETSTPYADEHDLVALGERVAWAVRGRGGEQGATLSLPMASPPFGPPAAIAPRSTIDVVFDKPAESVAIELRAEGLVMGMRAGDEEGRVLVDPDTLAARTSVSPAGSDVEVSVRRRPALEPLPFEWQKDVHRAPRPEPPTVDEPVDSTLFPAVLPWRAIAAPRLVVTSEHAAPAPVVRAIIDQEGARVVVTGFDPRQLELRVVPGPASPAPLAGLPGTGRLPLGDVERMVASAAIMPVRAAVSGALERGRVIAPLAVDAPRIAADEHGDVSLLGSESFAPFGAVQTAAPSTDEPVAAWCRTASGAIVVATARPARSAVIDKALAPLACRDTAWVSDATVDAEPRVAATVEGDAPFAAFIRARAFPDGRKEAWTASGGRQPTPAFRPAILEREETVLGEKVRVVAFVEGRFSWVLRAGTKERSHRAGGTFPQAIEEPLLARALAAVDVGIGLRKRPNGLTIGGSTGHAYAARGAVLFASSTGLALLPSAEVREDPREDAVELPLTASGGSPTPVALKRGLLQERGDICVLPDGTALVALARFDSHAATAEVLCRLGCSDAAALDRGLDAIVSVSRAGSDPLPSTHPSTRLVALEPGSPETP